ncbi:MAG: 16S rRNA (adenine(1518)-N(6)/adenine(1519)-N(6))-dimethyltransferase RsmA [candidate division WOR-3 bacterium]
MAKFRPKKQLGQTFLTYQPIAEQLVNALNLTINDEVLEIGAGKGILTEKLVQKAKYVYAVEIDKRLVEKLKEKLGNYNNLEIIHQDILRYDLSRHRQLKIIGNIPYSLSSPILFYLLQNRQFWNSAILTLQKEFAERILAQPSTKEYGALTVIFNLYTEAKKLFNIPPIYFRPKPKVFSTAVILKVRQQPLLPIPDEKFFIQVVKSAFRQRRKTLLNNLHTFLGIDKSKLTKTGIDMNRRAETLTLAEFVMLCKQLFETQ